jgi:hypothetical protein
VADDRAGHRQTAAADLADLQSATSDRGLTGRYTEVREAIAKYGDEVASWREEAAWNDNPPPRPRAPELKVPAGLPGEFADYLAGAIAFHQGDLQRAHEAWERLLNRPAAERRYRSTWAAFMLGRASVEKTPADAVRWFERTRELAAQEGFPDPLGLAAASLGWQAKAELARRHPADALALYLRQMKTGDPSAVPSIRAVSRKLLEDPAALKAVAASNEARPIMTAYVLSRWDRVDYDGPLDAAPARKWLEALRAARVDAVPDADRLAWVCYRAGDFAAAGEWAKRARGDAPMARWIEAKLLMRAGKLEEAERVLLQVRLPQRPAPDHDLFQAYENGVQPAVQPRAHGDSAASLLARGEYASSLSMLLLGGYWSDAAYVAERVLTTDELTKYADQGWPVALASHRPDDYGDDWSALYGGLVSPSRERMAYDLRYLAGRRLVREGRYAEAEKFLPKTLAVPLKTLAGAVAEGRDAKRPAAERARSLFKAACMMRYQGLALMGTELEPDWFLYEAQYELDPYADARAAAKAGPLGPTQDEKARARKSRLDPNKRFHYRYRGMSLAQEAASLLPDGDEKARMLVSAGNWVEGRDPQAVRPLYDALQSCCANTDAARRAKRANAIPNLEDTCPAETQPRTEDQ